MREYGVSWLEIDNEWTLPQVFLFIRQILSRNTKRTNVKTITERDLNNSSWMSG